LLVSFKFELNMFVATLLGFFGVGLRGSLGEVRWPVVVQVGVCLAVAALFSARAARDSSEVLADVRAALVKGVGEPPFDKDGNPDTPSA
jgi:hypothetical protein